MSKAAPTTTVPRGALIGAGALVAFAIVAALAGRVTGIGIVKDGSAPVAESREVRFEDAPDGAVIVRSAETGRVVDVLAPNTNHFVRVTLRGFVKARRREHIDSGPPFRLSRLVDGKTVIEDAATRRRIDLDAFGRPNAGAFAAILAAAARTE